MSTASEDAFGSVRHGYAPVAPAPLDRAPTLGGSSREGELPGVRSSLRSLVEEGKATAASEMAVIKHRAALAANGGKVAVSYGGVALVLVLLALIALTVGLLLIAMEFLGPMLGLVVIVGGLLLIAAIVGLKVKSGAKDIRAAFAKQPEDVS